MKFYIYDEQYGNMVQQALFKLGYSWHGKTGNKLLSLTDTTLKVEDGKMRTLSFSDLIDDISPYHYLSMATGNIYDHHQNVIHVPKDYVQEDLEGVRNYYPENQLDIPDTVTPEDSVKWNDNSNPKAAAGSKSLPLHLVSPLIAAYGCLGKLAGSEKYGLSNFIGTEVVMTIYIDAIRRHLDKIMAGQEYDEVDGVPHWSALIANIDIILSARAAGTLIDDRPLFKGYEAEIQKLTPHVSRLKGLYKDKKPKHYYLKDYLESSDEPIKN